MRFHNFRCISFVSSESLKHVQKTPKSWEKVCSITIFHQNPEKTLLQAWKTLQTAFFFPPLFQTTMDKSLGTLLRFWGIFNLHRSNPSPHPTNNVERVYPEFLFRDSTLYSYMRCHIHMRVEPGAQIFLPSIRESHQRLQP